MSESAQSEESPTRSAPGTSTGVGLSAPSRVAILLGVVGAGVISGVLVLLCTPAPSSFPQGLGYPPSDFPAVFDAVTILTMVEVAVLIGLSATYWATYRNVRSPFTLSLAVAFSFFCLGAILGSPLVFDTFRLGLGPGLRYELYLLVVACFDAAFATLFYASL